MWLKILWRGDSIVGHHAFFYACFFVARRTITLKKNVSYKYNKQLKIPLCILSCLLLYYSYLLLPAVEDLWTIYIILVGIVER